MKNKKHNNFRVGAIFVAIILVSMSTLIPASQGLALDEKQPSDPKNTALTSTDFSLTIHRIKAEDPIEFWPWDQPDWRIYVFVNGMPKSYDCVGDDIIIDKNLIWEGIITDDVNHLDMELRLLERDDWPDQNDIADISAYAGGGPDNTNDFPRGAIFKRTYDLMMGDWEPVDETNDFLQCEYNNPHALSWYVVSGNFDGSTTVDENDATVWFNFSVGNRPPIPPEKPSGPKVGEIYETYEFSTKSTDPDGGEFQFGWDWNGDHQIDEVTDYYESWETATISHTWEEPGVYYVGVVAIDVNGTTSEWSDPLIVEMYGPEGISGFKLEDWSLGHVYTMFLDHYDTQNLIYTIQNAEYVVEAIAALIIGIAALAGYPLDINTAIAIAVAILQVGAAVIQMFDQGMGIYFRIYTIEVNGIPISFFAYIWSQSMGGSVNDENVAPDQPIKLSGPAKGGVKKDYTYLSSTTDVDGDRVFYIFDWGDGSYNNTEWYESGQTVSMSHSWSKKGSYSLRIKAIDDYGAESAWSDPFPVKMPRTGASLLLRLLEKFPNAFPILRYIMKL
jgi:hypothetical protein